MNEINILGVYISIAPQKEVINKIKGFLEQDRTQYYIVTPNPEIILEAEQDEEFFYIVNKADIAVPDGMGLKVAGWFLGKNISRITGADLVQDVLKLVEERSLKVGVIKPPNSLSGREEIEAALADRFPKLKTKVTEAPSSAIHSFYDRELDEFEPDVLLATLGAPFQEKLIYSNLENFPTVKLGIGVGGALDFLTGKISRAPKILRVLGLEWVWRLYKQPHRWRRIFRAVVVFLVKFFEWRFILPLKYRPNVACLLYKKENNSYKVLVVERREWSGHWQLPQGGTEGENIITAGSRELQEELNCSAFRPVTYFSKIHKYKFPKNMPRLSKHRGYKGQKQGLLIAEFTGRDEDISVNFWEHQNWKWVDWKDLKRVVPPVRKEAVRKITEKFQQEIVDKNT